MSQVNISLVSILYLLGAGQSAFLALALFTSRVGNRQANAYLGALTLLFTFTLLDYFADTVGLTQDYSWIQTLLWPKEFFYGVLIYLYVRQMTCSQTTVVSARFSQCVQFSPSIQQGLHFLPGLVHILVTWPLLLLSPARQTAILGSNDAPAISNTLDSTWAWLLGDTEFILSMLHIGIYLFLSARLIHQHRRTILQQFSYTEKVSLNWLRNLLYGLITVYCVWITEELNNDLLWNESLQAALGISIVILIYSMGYLGLRQPLIFGQQPTSKEVNQLSTSSDEQKPQQQPATQKPETTDEVKYQHSALSPELGKALMTDLDHLMEQTKPYLNSQLSLPQLASEMGVSVNYLSQAINEQKQQNFFDYINGYRVEEAKRSLVLNTQNQLTILDIAMNAGFNSKSAFYTAFKKFTQLTPGQYRAQQNSAR